MKRESKTENENSKADALDGEKPDTNLEKAHEILRRHVEGKGLRKTQERFAILDRAMRMKGHYSGDDLHARLESDGYHVSRSTVYSTLALLCDCGLIRRHLLNARRAGYEVAELNHCHLVCSECGKITEVATDGRQLPQGVDPGDFRASYYTMTVYGLCSDCQKKEDNRQQQ